MRFWSHQFVIALAFVFLFSGSNSYAEKDFLELIVADDYGELEEKTIKLEIPTIDQCSKKLNVFVNPEKTVAAGLNALDEIQNKKVASCVEEIVKNWQQKHTLPKILETATEPSFEDTKEMKEIHEEMEKVRVKMNCFNPYDPISHKADYEYVIKYKSSICTDWLSKEENAKLQAQLDLLNHQYDDEYKKLNTKRILWSFESIGWQEYIASIYETKLPEEPEELKVLRKKVNCYNNEPKSDPYYYKSKEEYIKKNCPEGAVSKADYEVFQAKKSKLSSEWYEIRNKAEEEHYKIRESFTSKFAFAESEKNQLLPLAKQLKCINPFKAGSGEFEYYVKENEEFCDGKISNEGIKEQINQKVKEILGDVDARIAVIKERNKKGEEERKEAIHLMMDKRIAEYGDRRLFSSYYFATSKNMGNPPKISSFCDNYAKSMKLDQKRALSIEKYQSRLRAFSDKKWNVLFEHGLSEIGNAVIESYTGSFYTTINKAIWNNKMSDELKAFKDTMNDALQGMQPYDKSPVKRFTGLPKEILDAHKEGGKICYDAFTSTSKKENWSWDGSHSFLIYPYAKGHYVEPVSATHGEEEVLFEAGTCFLVLKREPRKEAKDKIHFVMVELDEHGKVRSKIPEELAKHVPDKFK